MNAAPDSLPEPIPPAPPLPALRAGPTDGGASETEGWWSDWGGQSDEPFNSRLRWAGRLAFPLMILAVLFAWRGVKVSGGEGSVLPPWAWWTLAALCAVAGLAFVRLRHRRT